MPLTKFKLSSIGDGGISRAKLANDIITTDQLEDGTVVAVDIANDAITTEKLNGLTNSSSGIIKADGDGTLSVTTADLVDDTTPQLGGDLDGNGNSIDLSANTESMGIPTGTTAQRPSSPSSGDFRMNTTIGSVEFYDGTSWIATNLIPEILSVSGSIYNGLSSSLTLSLSNATDTIDVTFSESGTDIDTVSGVSVSSGSASVTVPSSVYNQTTGDTITIKIANQDGTPSSNTSSKTVVGMPTGGTVNSYGNYRSHTFTSTGNFVVPTGFSTTYDYLIVAGGGGGGGESANGGGGGGAGGMRTVTGQSISAGTYQAVVGLGGNGQQTGASGGSSSFNGTSNTGGGGGGYNGGSAGQNGGSGGGSGRDDPNNWGSGISGQGNRGGGSSANTCASAGGGGGKSQVGYNGENDCGTSFSNANSSAGGDGAANNYRTGSNITYAGGGGGAYEGASRAPYGGAGGGGTGGSQGNFDGGNGGTNTGGGGGGAQSNTAGNGGSGIVVIRYDISAL